MNVPLLVAGSLALLGTAIHGVAGDVLVLRQVSRAALPSTRLGGPETTKAMIRASWHIATIAFLTVGFALVLSGSVLHGETGRAVALVAACAATGFAALVVGGALARTPRSLFRHPAPGLLTAVAALAWSGIAVG